MTIGLVLDVLIICMLAATTGYGAVLNRRLGRLRAGQGEFAALIGSFNESARRAEACVHRCAPSARKAVGRSTTESKQPRPCATSCVT